MSKRKSSAEVPFQMAPMIDMVFLLLVFFMTVSTLAREARPEVDLPVSVTARVPEAAPPRDAVTVFPDGEGHRYVWNNQPVSADELAERLRELAAGGSGHELFLRGPPGLPWEAWSRLLDLCRQAGIAEIVFATFES